MKVPIKDLSCGDGRVCNLPHLGVYHAKKQKIRVVFNCGASCKWKGWIQTHQVGKQQLCCAVLSAIPEEERTTEVKELELDRMRFPLREQWCIQSNSLRFKIIILDKDLARRNLLPIVNSVYDPLGILATVMLPVKGILVKQFSAKYTTLLMLATVSYLLLKKSNNKVHCAFVIGKARDRLSLARSSPPSKCHQWRYVNTSCKYWTPQTTHWGDSRQRNSFKATLGYKGHTF